MINELYDLSSALDRAGIKPPSWHREYLPIPNIRKEAPCVEISIRDGKVEEISSVNRELGKCLRKYGSKQGSFPCMNLAPLYFVSDEDIKKEISSIVPDMIDPEYIERIQSWCTVSNWNKKFCKRYKVSMTNLPARLTAVVEKTGYRPLKMLIKEAGYFQDPEVLHSELKRIIFEMLHQKNNIQLALAVLFYQGKRADQEKGAYGNLSVALNTSRLQEIGLSAVSERFVREVNDTLLRYDELDPDRKDDEQIDAFGMRFTPVEEPMPEVKLAGGFDVKLRTMFRGQNSQFRYGKIENASYPIAPSIRKDLHAALGWLSDDAHKGITWINTDKGEVLFAYPSQIPQSEISFIRIFANIGDSEDTFEEQAKAFLEGFSKGRDPNTDAYADRITVFVLRKIGKGRSKIVYTRQTDSHEMESASERWTRGYKENLPALSCGKISVPFPLETADILNRVWRQDGGSASDKYKPTPRYHGIDLLLDAALPVDRELHSLVQGAVTVSPCLNKYKVDGYKHPIWKKIKEMTGLLGFLLYRKNMVKEKYMEDFPYLYGQLLKISDALHELYCKVVRKGDVPPQLAGSSLFQSAAEAPVRTLNMLGYRMNPYITWAKSYRYQKVSTKGIESWRAGWLLSLYEAIATRLYQVWSSDIRFNDADKAELFIGYLAAFPKNEKDDRESE